LTITYSEFCGNRCPIFARERPGWMEQIEWFMG
jgi:hypothetical protein